MAYTKLTVSEDSDSNTGIVILIFVEGTIIKPKSLFRLYGINSYIPIGNCVQIIAGWHSQGARIVYCTSRKKNINRITGLLTGFGFAGSALYYRSQGEQYRDIVEAVCPDILIEDNCRSIGGSWQMCISNVPPDIKANIKSIIVKEFKGIDHLPVDLPDLLL